MIEIGKYNLVTVSSKSEKGYDLVDRDGERIFLPDFEIDYDNQLRLSNIEFDGESDLEECICDYVEDCFNVIDAEDE